MTAENYPQKNTKHLTSVLSQLLLEHVSTNQVLQHPIKEYIRQKKYLHKEYDIDKKGLIYISSSQDKTN